MSIKIIKKGILDTMQDKGRLGYQHMGIGTSGVMDQMAFIMANALLGNDDEAVIEMHFPAAHFLFEKNCVIVLTGADFGAMLNGIAIEMKKPFMAQSGDELQFKKCNYGSRCYLAVQGGLVIKSWLHSYSTNLKAKAGGHEGRALLNGDIIYFKKEVSSNVLLNSNSFPWNDFKKWMQQFYEKNKIQLVIGQEYNLLNEASTKVLLSEAFKILPQSDRMGYRLSGSALVQTNQIEKLSSGVVKGTVQLIPSGQLIILMADCQTTGGYPVIAHVATVAMHRLAQYQLNESVEFTIITHAEASLLFKRQQKECNHWKEKCKLLWHN
jgi:antagonist of KipI